MKRCAYIYIYLIIICNNCTTVSELPRNTMSEVMNDHSVCEIHKYEIANNNILPVLDSLISLRENCACLQEDYHWYCRFYIYPMLKTDSNDYRVVLKNIDYEDPIEGREVIKGGFYYRNYLFVLNAGGKRSKDFDFVKETNCMIQHSHCNHRDLYNCSDSYFEVRKIKKGYKIIRTFCGDFR